MINDPIIIIGAGAAGLMAAKELSAAGEPVIILEARNRTGGRIYTERDPAFSLPIELGAEFVHGALPVTLNLLKEAGIQFHETGGEMWQANNGSSEQESQATDHWNLFEERMQEVSVDITINEFLDKYFPEEKYASLRDSVRGYATGYDSADPDKASTMALREEWLSDDNSAQYRLVGGHDQMVGYLTDCCKKQGCAIHLQTVARNIEWQKDVVKVNSATGEVYRGKKVIITLPVNALQAARNEAGAITFSPTLPHVTEAVTKMGMGAVIKILFEFKSAFWEDNAVTARIGKNLEHIGFILSDEIIPTWWTQYPAKTPLLTGWLGGPKAKAYQYTSDETIGTMAIDSLAAIFKITSEYIREQLVARRVVNWTADTYCRGSYSYATVETKKAREILETPTDDTIYFAGEAMFNGTEMGTVEAALASGEAVAKKILNH